MNFLRYSNLNNINIIPQDDFSELTQVVFSVVAENLSKSLGPLGSSAIIFDGTYTESTKDGFSILKNYTSTNLYKQMVLGMIKRPCSKMNNTVGDGTTTAIVLAQLIFEIYQREKERLVHMYRLPREFGRVWDKTVQRILERVSELKRPMNIDEGDVYKIAYVSSNGDEVVSETLEKAYKENTNPYIHIKDSGTDESYLMSVNGFEFPCNLIDPAYTRTDDFSIDFMDPVVMIFDHTLDVNNFEQSVLPLLELVRVTKRPFVVIAPLFEKTLVETYLKQIYEYEGSQFGRITLFPCRYSSMDLKEKQLNDLGAVLDCSVINKRIEEELIKGLESNKDEVWEGNDEVGSKYYKLFGYCKKMSTRHENGSIFEVDEMSERHQSMIKEAQQELDEAVKGTLKEYQNLDLKTSDARERLTRLEMNNCIYYVGAPSDLQKRILKDAIDDAVKCLRSAATHGVVPGCQITISKAAAEIANDEKSGELTRAIAEIIHEATIKVYEKVLKGPNPNMDPKVILSRIKDIKSIQVTNIEWGSLLELVVDSIVKNSIETGLVYDLEMQTYSDRIITSAETDLMVLQAASDLVKILIAGNQCVFLDRDIPTDEREVYSFGN